jgi:predicted nucleic-acid-binding protein
MYALDTNVLVRLLVEDDVAQAAQAERFISDQHQLGKPVLISLLVLMETEWVLRSRYEFSKEQILEALAALLDTEPFQLEDESAVARALHLWRQVAAGFADCLIAERHLALGAQATLTFDRQAARRAGMRLLT